LRFVPRGYDHSVTFEAKHGAVSTRDGVAYVVPAEAELVLKVPNKAGVSMDALDTPVLVVSLSATDLRKLGAKHPVKSKELFSDTFTVASALTKLKPGWLSDDNAAELRKQLAAVIDRFEANPSLRYNFVHALRSFDRFVRLARDRESCTPRDRWLQSHICIAICAAGSSGRFGEIAMPPEGPNGRMKTLTEETVLESPRTFSLDVVDDIWYLGSAGWEASEIAEELKEFGITEKHAEAVLTQNFQHLLDEPLGAKPASKEEKHRATRRVILPR
jgi:hypothetical protein